MIIELNGIVVSVAKIIITFLKIVRDNVFKVKSRNTSYMKSIIQRINLKSIVQTLYLYLYSDGFFTL